MLSRQIAEAHGGALDVGKSFAGKRLHGPPASAGLGFRPENAFSSRALGAEMIFSRPDTVQLMEQSTLITGAPGWLGTRFVRLLVNGIPEVPGMAAPEDHRQIRCLVLKGTPVRTLRDISPRIQVFEGDVRDPLSMKDFFRGAENAVVFHLTGIIHPNRIRDLYDINVGGIRNVLKGALSVGARRLIAVSSNSPAGFNPYSGTRV